MDLAALRGYSEAFGPEVFGLLSPKASVESKTSPGGTAPDLVDQRAGGLAKGSA
jgi:hypothetical protein